jgi:tRNA (guanine-N7-)-methyltransferase
MSRAQERSYEMDKQFLIPYSEGFTGFYRYFGNTNPLTIEIGFGMGKATAEIAAANPDQNYLGIEVFRAGIGKLLWEIKDRSLSNIRIIEHDAVEVVEKMIAPGSAAAFHLFFPDPWPKKRHHKRRLVQQPFAELIASRIQDGGYFYMTSDWENYAEEALTVLSAIPDFFNPYANTASNGELKSLSLHSLPAGTIGGFAPKIPWRPATKFEKKGIDKNHPIKEIYLIKKEGISYGAE